MGGGWRWLVWALLPLLSIGCGGGEDEDEDEDCEVDTSYDPQIDPASFVANIDNSLYPLVPGTKFTYQAGNETVVVEVTSEKKEILGVSCTVVHDVASVLGETIEDTFDWYAQDKLGNVWYFGEDTKELKNGKVISTEGSWEAGVDGAKPGMLVPKNPSLNEEYRQEYAPCEAEDMGEVLALSETVTVPAGTFTDCRKTRDFTPLEPDVNEEKFYCPGTGLVLAVDVVSGEREELVEKTP